jgi:hypothetical protein
MQKSEAASSSLGLVQMRVMVHKHPGSGCVRSEANVGPERVRRQPPGGIDRRPLCLAPRLPNRKQSGTCAQTLAIRCAQRDGQPSCWKNRERCFAPAATARSTPHGTFARFVPGFGGDEATVARIIGIFIWVVAYRGAGTVPAFADHNAAKAAFHLATQGVSHAEWPKGNETAPT